MSQIAKLEDAPRRQLRDVIDPIPVLDTSQFEHMQRIATVMARSSLVPETLCTFGPKDKKEDLPYEQVLSNCFLVVNQAVRWGLDPFAVAQCVSVVHGKLCYEGKLVAAVIEAKLGVRLNHHFVGESNKDDYRIYLCDRPFDSEVIVDSQSVLLVSLLKPGIRIPGFRLFDGSVGEWKTAGAGTPWTPKNYPRMLIYRGTRDWTRIYEPAVMLGIYTPDELLDLAENARALRARDISDRPSLADRLAAARIEPPAPKQVMVRAATADHDAETGEIIESQSQDASSQATGDGRTEASPNAGGAATNSAPTSQAEATEDGGNSAAVQPSAGDPAPKTQAQPADGVSQARKKGVEARAKGKSRKAVPAEFAKDERMTAAYLDGFDTGEEADREPGEEG